MLTEYLKVQMPYEELQNQSAGIYILAYTKKILYDIKATSAVQQKCTVF